MMTNVASPLPVAIVWMSIYPSCHFGRYSWAVRRLNEAANTAKVRRILFILTRLLYLSYKDNKKVGAERPAPTDL
jgi:hypothetical protein